MAQRLFHLKNSRSKPHPKDNDKIELFDDEGNSRGFYSKKNRLNELTGKEWQYWSKSVINKQYPPGLQHALRNQHGGQKPPDMCADLIKVFTKSGMAVLDPFAGVGGTLIGASLCNRKAVGIEINPKWVEIYKKVCNLEKIPLQDMKVGDSKELLKSEPLESYDFILTDVPYWNMDKVSRSNGRFKKTGEESGKEMKSKLSQFNNEPIKTKTEWLQDMQEIFGLCHPLLRPRSYLAVFIGDMYKNGRYHFLSNDLAGILEDIGFTPKANLIWYDVSNKLGIYGYRYEFIPSMIHQNILIFRKER
jgi:DNA modification methylase